MDSVLVVALFAIGGLLLFFILLLAGFQSKAPLKPPEVVPAGSSRSSETDGVPQPFAAYIESCHNSIQVPIPSSVIAWGRGRLISSRLPIVGKLWSPFSFTLFLSPGSNFVWRSHITWFGRSFLQGGDEFRNGHGKFNMGKTSLENPNLDLSLKAMLWIYTFLFAPSAVIGRKDISYKKLDDYTLEVTVEEAEQVPLTFVLKFDPENGELIRIETQRKTSKGGALPFHVDSSNPLQFDPQIALPGKVVLNWEDETYSRFEVMGVHFNVDIQQAMENGI
jgi:hypothetical protein